jgi:hypothetical protein
VGGQSSERRHQRRIEGELTLDALLQDLST